MRMVDGFGLRTNGHARQAEVAEGA